MLIGFLNPLAAGDTVRALAGAGVTSFAMEADPAHHPGPVDGRTLLARPRSPATSAALIAAEELPRFFPMLTTAAGTVRPAKVLVLGAGVAGLQAIATARRLGAIVQAFDVRSAVKEQIESLGAKLRGAGHRTRGRRDRGRLRTRADRGGAGSSSAGCWPT